MTTGSEFGGKTVRVVDGEHLFNGKEGTVIFVNEEGRMALVGFPPDSLPAICREEYKGEEPVKLPLYLYQLEITSQPQ